MIPKMRKVSVYGAVSSQDIGLCIFKRKNPRHMVIPTCMGALEASWRFCGIPECVGHRQG